MIRTDSKYLFDGQTFEYKNQVATYQLRFRSEPEILPKCEILCAKEKLEEELLKTIDQWGEPEQMDVLDLKATVYDAIEFYGTVYFIRSYTVEVELVSLNGVDM